MGKFKHLFSPLKVGSFTYKNRIESAPMAFALIACNPEAADKSFRKLEAPARGGYACVAVGELDVNFRDAIRIPLPPVDFTQTDGYVVEKVGEYAGRIKKHGAIAICELMHAGAEENAFRAGPGIYRPERRSASQRNQSTRHDRAGHGTDHAGFCYLCKVCQELRL